MGAGRLRGPELDPERLGWRMTGKATRGLPLTVTPRMGTTLSDCCGPMSRPRRHFELFGGTLGRRRTGGETGASDEGLFAENSDMEGDLWAKIMSFVSRFS